jgi:hypothetical protein
MAFLQRVMKFLKVKEVRKTMHSITDLVHSLLLPPDSIKTYLITSKTARIMRKVQ